MSADAASTPWDLLARQLAGEATPAEAAVVRAWAAASPDNAAMWRQLSGVWAETASATSTATPVFTAADTANAWQRFEAQVMGPPPPSAPPNAPSSGPSAPPSSPAPPPPAAPLSLPGAAGMAGWGKVAALLVAGAGAGWLLRTAIPAESGAAQRPVAVAMAPAAAAAASADAARQSGPAEVDLVFEETPVAEVALRLERTFGGTHVVVIDSALARQRFTGTFQAARPVVVLRVVSLAAGATLTHRPDSTWVIGRGSE